MKPLSTEASTRRVEQKVTKRAHGVIYFSVSVLSFLLSAAEDQTVSLLLLFFSSFSLLSGIFHIHALTQA